MDDQITIATDLPPTSTVSMTELAELMDMISGWYDEHRLKWITPDEAGRIQRARDLSGILRNICKPPTT